jgi:hypothetical protein
MYTGLQECEVCCPWCWQAQNVVVDCSAGEQRLIEDCAVCCHPMELSINLEDGGIHVLAERAQ